VEKLMDLADAILLDLRGFRAERAGTAYEIRRLAVKARRGRVVAVGNAVTDWACVESLFGEGDGDRVRERRLDADAPEVAKRCIEALLAVSVSGRATP
jgi:nucleoside 2-deoxyribosyltransferase